METASINYIINTVFKTNILPVISECNTNCIFCSHKQNPKGLQIYKMPKLSIDEFRNIIEFISPDRKIVIGEAATRIIEGEPFLYKDILLLIELIRNKYKNTPIQLTTNGLLLEESIVNALEELGNIELNISVNCIDKYKHKKILGLKAEVNIEEKLRLLKGRIKYSGSCVFIPGLMDKKDIEDIIHALEKNGADTLRLFIPGYTKLNSSYGDFFEIFNMLKEITEDLKIKYSLPVIIEPSLISDLECRIEGIIENTPASRCGIKPDDIVTTVNSKPVDSRVDAFDKIYRAFNPELKIIRNDSELNIKLLKPKNSSPGFVVLFDIDPDLLNRINNTIKHNKAKQVLIITSELGEKVLTKYLDKSPVEFEYNIISAHCSYFGGNIKCGGLLVIQDILDALEEYLRNNPSPELILLPNVMFDSKRKDLLGRGLDEIEAILGIKADIP